MKKRNPVPEAGDKTKLNNIMMDKDVVFRLIPEGELADPNTFCHYGWEGTGSFALWK